MELTELLCFFNLTHQEATLYLLLCGEGRLTGYEAAKLSGVSRSNTYTALAALVDKGAARIEEDTATRYTAVPIREFCDNRLRKMQEYSRLLAEAVPQCREEAEGYLTIKGEKNIFDKMKNLIDDAKERIYIAVSQRTLAAVLPQLENAVVRGLKVVIITDYPIVLDGALIHYAKTKEDQIRLIADSRNVLTGEIAFGAESTCLYSQKRNLVDLIKESLKNEIELIVMREETDRK